MRSLSSPISKAGWWSLCSPPSAHLRHRSPPWQQEPSMYETRRTGSAEQWSLWWNGNEGDSACRHTHKYQAPMNSRLLLLLPASYHKTFSTCTVGVWKGQTVHFYKKLEINSAKRHHFYMWIIPWSTYRNVFLIFSEKCSSHIMMSNTQMAY